MKTGIVLLLTLVSSLLWAVDPHNTYQWNRKNHFRQNRQIDKSPWFEWWYYKVVLPETNDSYYFVYGVVNPWDKTGKMKGTRSYVEMGDFAAQKILDQKHSLAEFSASYDQVYVRVRNNEATDTWLKGEIQDESGELYSWHISVKHEWSFPATGWALGRNITSIEWYPAQADAKCSGWIQSGNEYRQFVDAPCYQDRNWGKIFPDWWTWIVSNQFENHPDTTLAIGGGRPHVLGVDIGMEGVAVGLKHKGVEYAFRPNDLDRVKIDISFGKWIVAANDDKYKVEIEAFAPKETFMDLQFMTPQGEVFHDYETLTGSLTLKLYKKRATRGIAWGLVDTIHSSYAGIEYGSKNTFEEEKIFEGTKNLQR